MNATTNAGKKMSAAQFRAQYGRTVESQVRAFSSYLREIQADMDCTDLTALADAKKAAATALADAKKANKSEAEIKHLTDAKKAADNRYNVAEQRSQRAEMQDRLKQFNDMLQGAKFERCDLTPGFLKAWLGHTYNKAGQICDCRKIDLENESQARIDAANGLYEIVETDAVMYELVPVKLWSAAKLLSKFAAAARLREKALKAESQMQREAESAAKKAAQIAALEQKLAKMKAEQQRADADAAILSEMKADAAQKAE